MYNIDIFAAICYNKIGEFKEGWAINMDINQIKEELKRKKEYIAAQSLISRYDSISEIYKETVDQFKEAKEILERYKDSKNSPSEKELSYKERKDLNKKKQNNFNNYNDKCLKAEKRKIDLKAKLDSLNAEYEKAVAFIEKHKTLKNEIEIISDLDEYINRNYINTDIRSLALPIVGALGEIGSFIEYIKKYNKNSGAIGEDKPYEDIGDYLKDNIEEDFFDLLSSHMKRCIDNKLYKS